MGKKRERQMSLCNPVFVQLSAKALSYPVKQRQKFFGYDNKFLHWDYAERLLTTQQSGTLRFDNR